MASGDIEPNCLRLNAMGIGIYQLQPGLSFPVLGSYRYAKNRYVLVLRSTTRASLQPPGLGIGQQMGRLAIPRDMSTSRLKHPDLTIGVVIEVLVLLRNINRVVVKLLLLSCSKGQSPQQSRVWGLCFLLVMEVLHDRE